MYKLYFSILTLCSLTNFTCVASQSTKSEKPSSEHNVKRILDLPENQEQTRSMTPTSKNSSRQSRSGREYSTYKVPKNHLLLDYGWSPRQLSSLASTNLLPSTSPNEYPYPVSGGGGMMSGGNDDDNAASAGGHGWGWEKDQGKNCNSALGLLGILGLATYLQNVLRQMNDNNDNNTPSIPSFPGEIPAIPGGGGGIPGKRGKRSERSASQIGDSTAAIIPKLLQLNSIREGKWPVSCSSYPICMLCNIVGEFYAVGKTQKTFIKNTLEAVIGEVLSPVTMQSAKQKLEMKTLVDWAVTVGLKRGRCDRIFKDCSTLSQ